MVGTTVSQCSLSAATPALPTARARRRLGSPFRAAIEALRADMSLRAAEAQLQALDRRMLKDIGIDRSEIRSVLTDRTGDRNSGALRQPKNIGHEANGRDCNITQEIVMTRSDIAMSSLILTAAVIFIGALAMVSSDLKRAEARHLPGSDPSVHPSAIMRHAPLDLPVENHPMH